VVEPQVQNSAPTADISAFESAIAEEEKGKTGHADNSGSTMTSETSAKPRGIFVHRSVLAGYPHLEQKLTQEGVTITDFGDPNQPPQRLVIAFGHSASLSKLRSIVAAIGLNEPILLAELGQAVDSASIVVGAEGGEGTPTAKLADIHGALSHAGSAQELIAAIEQNAKPQ
jgi:hypothetical protein